MNDVAEADRNGATREANLPGAVIAELVAAVGEAHVQVDADSRRSAETATYATNQRVPAIVRPGSREEVQACLRVANRTRTPLYPISCGKNWGMGSKVPVQDGCVILDLGRMDRIVDHSEELGYVTVQPGVTFGQLHAWLLARSSKLMLNATGSTPDSSVLGNAVDRGHGYGPAADRFGSVCALEVVLPDGSCIHTGFDRFAGAHTAPLHRWGVGPSLDGLFAQSNLGVVTQLTTWLPRQPKEFQFAIFRVRHERLDEVVDALRDVRADPLNDVQIQNDAKQRFWARVKGQPVSGGVGRAQSWLGSAGLYASSIADAVARREQLRRALEGKVQWLRFFGPRIRKLATALQKPLAMVGVDVGVLPRLGRTPWLGCPDYGSVGTAYWPKGRPAPAVPDLDRDRCGHIALCPTLPFVGSHVRRGVDIIEDLAAKHGFEAAINLRPMTGRSIDIVSHLMYDRDEVGMDERAAACSDAMLEQLAREGYLPYRLGIQQMGNLPPARDDYAAFMQRLKGALDPNDILAPGRHDMRNEWPR